MARACPPNTFPYTVRPGDTYFSLARRFNTTVPALVSANPLTRPEALQVGQTICIPRQQVFPACPEGNFHTIRPGDTLYSLARFYNVSLDDLLEANPGLDPDRLTVGQVICIPVAAPPVRCGAGTFVYTIRPGDTLFSLAQKYNTTTSAILGANPGLRPEALLAGQNICIPGKGQV